MRGGILALLLLLAALPVRAQTINGESTDDSAYAPRPAARWHAPDAPPDATPESAPLGIDPARGRTNGSGGGAAVGRFFL